MAARRSTRMSVAAEQTVEHVLATSLAKLLVVAPPWVAWLASLALAAWLHHTWAGALPGVLVGGGWAGLACLAAHLTHHRRSRLARYIAAATFTADGIWIGWTVAAGLGWHALTYRLWLFLGIPAALAWSVWLNIHDMDDGHVGPSWFHTATTAAGAPMKLRVAKAEPNRVTGTILHRGMVTEDVGKAMGEVESRAGLPRGSIKVVEHPTDAGQSQVTIINPTTLAAPALYRGPSAPGASMAQPVHLAGFADGTPLAVALPGWHVQVMGQTGAAKTTGYGYTELGETITRADAAVLGIDIAKGKQFMGPLTVALHRLATEPDEAREVLYRLCAQGVRARTDYLAELGLQTWEPGCGLSFLTCWVEEASWVFKRALSDADIDKWLVPGVVAARSAGVRFAFSIQRADFTMMPTVVRAQMGRITMGLAGAEDAAFGLTDFQADRGCEPGRWGNKKPGMLYAGNIPGLDEDHEIMEARTPFWGPDTRLITAHAARYPAAARPMDAWTAAALQPPVSPSSALPTKPPQPKPAAGAAAPKEDTMRLPGRRPAPPPPTVDDDADEPTGYDDPGLYTPSEEEAQAALIDPADYDPTEPGWVFGDDEEEPGDGVQVTRLPTTSEQARQALTDLINHLHGTGETELTMEHLAELCEELGRSRTWPYEVLAGYVASGVLDQLDRPRRWRILREAA